MGLGGVVEEGLDQHVLGGVLEAARPVEPQVAGLGAGGLGERAADLGQASACSGLMRNLAVMTIIGATPGAGGTGPLEPRRPPQPGAAQRWMAAGRPSLNLSGGEGRHSASPAARRAAVHATAQASTTSSGATPRSPAGTSGSGTSMPTAARAAIRSARPSGVRFGARIGAPLIAAKVTSGLHLDHLDPGRRRPALAQPGVDLADLGCDREGLGPHALAREPAVDRVGARPVGLGVGGARQRGEDRRRLAGQGPPREHVGLPDAVVGQADGDVDTHEPDVVLGTREAHERVDVVGTHHLTAGAPGVQTAPTQPLRQPSTPSTAPGAGSDTDGTAAARGAEAGADDGSWWRGGAGRVGHHRDR